MTERKGPAPEAADTDGVCTDKASAISALMDLDGDEEVQLLDR